MSPATTGIGMGRFLLVGEDAIRNGRCTDIYFERVTKVMEKDGVNPHVTMEVTAAALPDPWGVFCGLSDVVELLEGVPVDVDAMPEGAVFGPNEPVLRVSGRYRDFAVYETAILGFLCHASGSGVGGGPYPACGAGPAGLLLRVAAAAPGDRGDDRAGGLDRRGGRREQHLCAGRDTARGDDAARLRDVLPAAGGGLVRV